MSDARGRKGTPTASLSGEAAARARLETLFRRIDRLIPDDLAHIGLAPDRTGSRAGPRRIAEDAVRRARLDWLADEARSAARDRLIERWAGALYRPTWAGGLNWGVSTGRARDRAEVVRALEDAALAAVAEGHVDDEVLAALAGDADAILGMATGGPAEESLAAAMHVAAVAGSPAVGAGLIALLLVVIVPTVSLVIFGGAAAGDAGAVSVGLGALVLAGSIAVLAVRRARRALADAPDPS